MTPKITPHSLVFSVVLLLLLLASCSTPPTQVPTESVEVTQTAAPIVTPTTIPEPVIVRLIAGPNADPILQEQATVWLTGQSSDENFDLELMDSFNSAEPQTNLQTVIFLSAPDDLVAIAGSLPDTKFVAFSSEDLQPAANLSIIKTSDLQAVFLAGYLATLNAPDFRSGALFIDGKADSAERQDAFLNGGRYFCGRCAPVFAPIVLFPKVGLVPAGADAAGWQAAFDTLNQNNIEMLYLPADGMLPDFLAYLADKGVKIITPTPLPDQFLSFWVANVESTSFTTLVELWPQLAEMPEGKLINAGVQITQNNPDNLSPGRLQLAERIIPDLINGIIFPLSVP